MDRYSFIVHIKQKLFIKIFQKMSKKDSTLTNYEVDRPLPIEKNGKVLGLMKDEIGGKIMTKFVGLRSKTCSYLKDNNNEEKKAKGTKSCLKKRKLKFQDYKNCLKSSQIINIVNYLEKKGINVDSLKEDKTKFIKIG